MNQNLKPSEPNLIIRLNVDDTDKFIAAVTKALCNGWSRFQDVPASPGKPAIYRFIRDRPGVKNGAICLQRVDPEKMASVCLPSTVKPMSTDELTAFIEEFVEDILERVHATGIQFTACVYKHVVFRELMDPKALELFYYFSINTDKEHPLDQWEDRDRFQQFLIRLHRTTHRLTPEIMFYWATEQEGMSVDAAGAIGIAFEFALQNLQLYDRYLENEKHGPESHDLAA